MRMTQARLSPGAAIAAALVVCAAPAFFVLEWPAVGFALLAAGLLTAWIRERGAPILPPAQDASTAAREPSLLRDLSLIAAGLAVVRSIPLAAELHNWAMVRFTLALGGAVVVPYLLSRFFYRDHAVRFPWRRSHDGGPHPRWGRLHWGWLASVLVLGWLILPWYFMGSGVYRNWPAVEN